MKIFVDADGCPVTKITVNIAKKYNLQCTLLCDTSHVINSDYAEVITVCKGADSVDFALVNRVSKGDIVVTQDYGLAAMCLAKSAIALNQNGLVFSNDNIDALLLQRHTAKKIRNSGGRFKNHAKRTQNEDIAFENALTSLILQNL
ncbi:MAG: YaiI/YqxD family protein [Clostridia bacterium]